MNSYFNINDKIFDIHFMFGTLQNVCYDILEWWFAIIFEIKVVPVEWIGLTNKGDNEMDRLFIHPYTHDKIFCHISKNYVQCDKKYSWHVPSCS
jgi:hypothetical protein